MLSADGHEYKALEHTCTRVGGGKAVFYFPLLDRSHVLPAALATVLARCDRFLTLDAHVKRLQTEGALDKRAAAEVLHALEWLVEHGILISRTSTLHLLTSGRRSHSRASIQVIGIPTADRPTRLARALKSYLRNTERYGRKIVFVVVDDSRSPKARAHNRDIVAATARRGGQVYYVGSRQRLRLVQRLAAVTGIDEPNLRFSLLQSSRHRVTTGAARNTLLLLTAGVPSLQVDDDTVAATASRPGTVDPDAVACSSRRDPTSFWFDTWPELKRLQNADCDILALHERLLGRTVAECLCDRGFHEQRVDDAETPFLLKVSSGKSVIRTTTLGVLGDPGISAANLLLWTPPEARPQLLASRETYDTALRHRRLYRAAPCHTISDSHVCLAMNLGLDGSEAVPPFLPIGRGQDFVFGVLGHRTGALAGFLPYGILHLGARKTARPTPSTIGRISLPQVSHLLVQMLEPAALPTDRAPEGTLHSLGTGLLRLSTLSRGDFRSLVQASADATRLRWLSQTYSLAEEPMTATDDTCSAQLRELANQLESAITAGNHTPTELVQGFAAPLDELRRLAVCFGQQLTSWADLIRTAARQDLLHEIGARING